MSKRSILLVFLLSACLSCDPKHDRNNENIHKIKEGMTFREVDSIMGPADIRSSGQDSTADELCYMWNAMFMASDNYYVYFTKEDSIVSRVNYGD